MARQPKTYIQINGETRDAASLKNTDDRTFRGAWQFDGDAIAVDMAKAKEIKADQLRAERAEAFGALDAQYMQALEQDDAGARKAVASKKQKLRDVTKHAKLTKAKTPEELAALTLADLT